MTREEAIDWCRTNYPEWVNSVHFRYPEGWRWVICQLPYQLPEFKLVNAKSEEIRQEDV